MHRAPAGNNIRHTVFLTFLPPYCGGKKHKVNRKTAYGGTWELKSKKKELITSENLTGQILKFKESSGAINMSMLEITLETDTEPDLQRKVSLCLVYKGHIDKATAYLMETTANGVPQVIRMANTGAWNGLEHHYAAAENISNEALSVEDVDIFKDGKINRLGKHKSEQEDCSSTHERNKRLHTLKKTCPRMKHEIANETGNFDDSNVSPALPRIENELQYEASHPYALDATKGNGTQQNNAPSGQMVLPDNTGVTEPPQRHESGGQSSCFQEIEKNLQSEIDAPNEPFDQQREDEFMKEFLELIQECPQSDSEVQPTLSGNEQNVPREDGLRNNGAFTSPQDPLHEVVLPFLPNDGDASMQNQLQRLPPPHPATVLAPTVELGLQDPTTILATSPSNGFPDYDAVAQKVPVPDEMRAELATIRFVDDDDAWSHEISDGSGGVTPGVPSTSRQSVARG